MENYAVEMLHITKRFPGIIANDDITIQLKKGEIHALLGENGAGKSTLMSVLFGLYQPEEGEIRMNGKKVRKRCLRFVPDCIRIIIFTRMISVRRIRSAPAISVRFIRIYSA